MDPLAERIDRIERKLDLVLAQLQSATTPRPARAGSPENGTATTAPEIAPDADLDGPRGNPEVRFVPRRWTGADFKGRRFSECEADFLEMLADAYEWFAQRDDESGALDKNGSPKSRWSRLDAARARGWAGRLRAGATANGPSHERPRRSAGDAPRAPRATTPRSEHVDDDIPF